MATKVENRVTDHRGSPTRPGKRWWERALRLLPAAAFLATFGFFFVDKNEAARSVFKSGRGFLTMAAIVGGYVVIAIVLRRFVRWAWVAPVVLTGVIVGLAAWIVRPYYVDETDNTLLVRGPVVDASEIEPASPSSPDTGAVPPEQSAPPTTAAPVGPVRVAAGTIRGLDGHSGSGGVSLIRETNGSFVVRFENFDIEGTPDPVVYVVQGNDVQRRGGTSLGSQRGNQGVVSDYAVPAGVSPGDGWTVLVWCESFAVPIANATLGAV